MFAQCPFCLEELDAHNTPVAMPCGHMYCLDCATFWFNQSDAPQKCTCGRMFKGDEIIKLWTNANDPSGASCSNGAAQHEHALRGREVLAACNAAVRELEAGRQGNMLSATLSKTQTYLDTISARDQEAATQNILKSLRSVLSEIRTKLQQQQNARQQQTVEDDRLRIASKEIKQLKAKMARDIQEIYHQSLVQEESARREIAEHEEKERELQQKLQDTRRALDTVRRHLESSRLNETALEEAVAKLRKGELRYKKKYYALKQEVDTIKQTASGQGADPEDDSLLVL